MADSLDALVRQVFICWLFRVNDASVFKSYLLFKERPLGVLVQCYRQRSIVLSISEDAVVLDKQFG